MKNIAVASVWYWGLVARQMNLARGNVVKANDNNESILKCIINVEKICPKQSKNSKGTNGPL